MLSPLSTDLATELRDGCLEMMESLKSVSMEMESFLSSLHIELAGGIWSTVASLGAMDKLSV